MTPPQQSSVGGGSSHPQHSQKLASMELPKHVYLLIGDSYPLLQRIQSFRFHGDVMWPSVISCREVGVPACHILPGA